MANEAGRKKSRQGVLLRHCLGVCGVLAAGVLIVVSAAMNWRFGYSLGRSHLDGMIYGTASAAADCLKALVPFFFFGALRNRMWSHAAAAAIVGIVVTGYSLASAFGHAAQNRSDTTGRRAAETRAYKDLGDDLKRAKDQLSWVPPHRPATMVKSEIDGLRIQREWTLTEECRAVNRRAGREFCRKYHELVAEAGSGEQAEALEARISEIEGKLARFAGTSVADDADPQAALLAKILGFDVERVQLGLMIFVSVLLEVGSGMGMYMALSQWRIDGPEGSEPRPREDERARSLGIPVSFLPPKEVTSAHIDTGPIDVDADVRRFCDDRVRKSPGRTIAVTSLYDGYRLWCEEQDTKGLALPTFVRAMDELGIRRIKTEDGLHYLGIALDVTAIAPRLSRNWADGVRHASEAET